MYWSTPVLAAALSGEDRMDSITSRRGSAGSSRFLAALHKELQMYSCPAEASSGGGSDVQHHLLERYGCVQPFPSGTA